MSSNDFSPGQLRIKVGANNYISVIMNALQRAVSLLHVTVEGRVAITDVTDLEA
jgi:hypothetical protein